MGLIIEQDNSIYRELRVKDSTNKITLDYLKVSHLSRQYSGENEESIKLIYRFKR